MRRLVSMGLTAFISAAGGAGAATAAEQPFCDLSLAPVAVLLAHAHASPVGQVLAEPQAEPLHHSFEDNSLSELASGPLFDTLAAETGLGLRLYHLRAPDNTAVPDLAASGEVGAESPNLFKSWKALLDLPSTPTPVAGCDESAATLAWQLQRRGAVLTLASSARALAPWTPDLGGHDLRLVIHGGPLLQEAMSLVPAAGDFHAALQALMPTAPADADLGIDCGASGLHLQGQSRWPMAGLSPLPAAAFAALPGTCLQVYAVGLDAQAWWHAYRGVALGLCPGFDDAGVAADSISAREDTLDHRLADLGLPPLAQCLAAINGPVVLFVTAHPPIGGYSLQLPRSPALDALLTAMLHALPSPARELPAAGVPVTLTNPAWPVAVQLVLTPSACLLSTDPQVVAGYPQGSSQGTWSASVSGQAVLAHLGLHTVALQGGDTRATLVALSQLGGSFLANLELSQAICQSAYTALKHLAQAAPAEWLAVDRTEHGLDVESQGLFVTGMGPVVWLAAAGVDAVLSDRPEAPGDVVMANLRSVVLNAEHTFQVADDMDEDGKGVGEYGFFSEMTGTVKDANNQPLQLIDTWFDPANTGGFRYVIYLPDAPDRSLTDPGAKPRQGAAAGIDLRRRYWLCYAYPSDAPPPPSGPASAPADRAWMYAIDQTGTIYRSPYQGTPPHWNDLFGGKTWLSPPVWPLISSP